MENEELNSEIGELLDLSNEPVLVEPPVDDMPIDEPAPAEPPSSEDSSVLTAEPEPGSEPPPAEPAPASAPTEPEPTPAVVDERDSQIAQMRETIEALQKTINEVATARREEPAPAPSAPTEPSVHKFIEKEEDLDKALSSVDEFNSMMSGILNQFRETMLGVVQQVAVGASHGVYTQRTAVDEFYRANQDLASNKAYVGIVADEIARLHPDWDMLKVMEGLADEVRSRLRLSGQNPSAASPVQPLPTPEPSSEPAPAFAGGASARPSGNAPQVSKLEKEIGELLDGFV